MRLKTELEQKLFEETTQKLAIIDAASGMLAECEALAEQLNKAAIGHRFHPAAHMTFDEVTCRVYVAYERISAVRDSIQRAGLKIHIETGHDGSNSIGVGMTHHITLDGLCVPIVVINVIAEADEVLKKAA